MRNNPMSNPMQIMQMFQQFSANFVGNPEEQGRQLIQSANLNQNQLNKLQSSANMIYGMAQRFGLIK